MAAPNASQTTPDDPTFTTLPAGARCAHCKHLFRAGEESFSFQCELFCGMLCMKTHLGLEILGCDRFRQWLPSASGGRALRIPHYVHYLVATRVPAKEVEKLSDYTCPSGYIVGRVRLDVPPFVGCWWILWDLEGKYAWALDPLYWNDAVECPWR